MRVNGRTESRKNVYFVSGIDTGIGKTAVTGLMARSLASAGRDVITVKLVQTGNDGYSEDIDAHRLICGGVRFPEDGAGLTAPQVFSFSSFRAGRVTFVMSMATAPLPVSYRIHPEP